MIAWFYRVITKLEWRTAASK